MINSFQNLTQHTFLFHFYESLKILVGSNTIVSKFALVYHCSLALSLTCLAYGLSWPVRSSMYLDTLNMYRDVIRWKEYLNQELKTFTEIQTICSTLLEWRQFVYAIALNLFWGSFLFR